MRLFISVAIGCLTLVAAQPAARAQTINGDEFATSRKYCDDRWKQMTAENATGNQTHEAFTRRCVCDRRWQEKVEAKIGDERTREKDRRRCLGVYVDNDYPEYLLVGGLTVIGASFLLPGSNPVSP